MTMTAMMIAMLPVIYIFFHAGELRQSMEERATWMSAINSEYFGIKLFSFICEAEGGE